MRRWRSVPFLASSEGMPFLASGAGAAGRVWPPGGRWVEPECVSGLSRLTPTPFEPISRCTSSQLFSRIHQLGRLSDRAVPALQGRVWGGGGERWRAVGGREPAQRGDRPASAARRSWGWGPGSVGRPSKGDKAMLSGSATLAAGLAFPCSRPRGPLLLLPLAIPE